MMPRGFTELKTTAAALNTCVLNILNVLDNEFFLFVACAGSPQCLPPFPPEGAPECCTKLLACMQGVHHVVQAYLKCVRSPVLVFFSK